MATTTRFFIRICWSWPSARSADETANMAYPNAYILAAQTLGLTEDIDNVNFKAQLTRGETAQIIWNMLNTEVAYIDPLTNELIYPGQEDTSPYGMLIGAGKIERVILLEKAGYASGKIEGNRPFVHRSERQRRHRYGGDRVRL